MILPSGERATENLAVDSNVILSALIGGKAGRIMSILKGKTRFVTTGKNIDEVKEYLPALADEHDLNAELLLTALDTLPIEIIPANSYRHKIDDARKRIGQRDPDDVDLLALALAENIPVWSADKDFESAGVEHYTTSEILKSLSG